MNNIKQKIKNNAKLITLFSAFLIFLLTLKLACIFYLPNPTEILPAQAGSTFTVNSTADDSDDDAGDGDCDIGDGDCTLRAAIEEVNALGAGNTISIGAIGTTTPASALPQINSATTTITGPGSDGFVIDGVNTTDQNGFTVNGSDFTITGVTIKNFDSEGILINVSGGCASSTISNNRFISNGWEGIKIYNDPNDGIDKNITISDNFSTTNTQNGIKILNVNNVSIQGNTTTFNTQDGINLNTASSTTINNNISTSNSADGIDMGGSGNTATNNTVTSNGVFGIFFGGNNNTISTNTVSLSTYSGIQSNNASNATVSGNTSNSNSYQGISIGGGTGTGNRVINNNTHFNTMDGISTGSGVSGTTVTGNTSTNNGYYGIILDAVAGYLADSNTVTNNTVASNTLGGILVETDNNTVTSNTIYSNTTYGVYFKNASSTGNTLDSNTIYENGSDGIYTDGSSSNNTISSNTIYSNLGHGVNVTSSGNYQITENEIYSHGTTTTSYWLSAISPLKYGSEDCDEEFMGSCGAEDPAVMYYDSGSDDWTSICSTNTTVVPDAYESAAEAAGGFDAILMTIDVGGGPATTTAYTDKGAFTDLATIEAALVGMGTAQAYIHNIMTKSGDTWTYNGIVDGVNGVVVETDGESVSLVDTEPSLSTYTTYLKVGIVLGTATTTSVTKNTFYNNGITLALTGDCSDIILTNNIMWGKDDIISDGSNSPDLTNTYNLVWSDTTLDDWYGGSASWGEGEIHCNPSFTSTSGPDFTLQDISCAIEAASDGTDLGANDYTGGGQDTSLTVDSSGADFTTLQGAIDASWDDYTITAAAGTYSEGIDFESKSSVTLTGAGSSSTVVSGTTAGLSFTGTSSDITVTDLALTGATTDLISSSAGTNTLNRVSFSPSSYSVTAGQVNINLDTRCYVDKESDSTALEGANCTIFNKDGATTVLGTTGSDGYSSYTNLNPFNIDSSGLVSNQNDYKLTATKAGYSAQDETFTINTHKQTLSASLSVGNQTSGGGGSGSTPSTPPATETEDTDEEGNAEEEQDEEEQDEEGDEEEQDTETGEEAEKEGNQGSSSASPKVTGLTTSIYQPTNTKLIKFPDSSAVYVVNEQDNTLEPIISAPVFETRGFSWDQIEQVEPEAYPNYQTGSHVFYSEGTLVKSDDKSSVYLLDNNQKRPIISAQAFITLGYMWDKIQQVATDILNFLDIGEMIR